MANQGPLQRHFSDNLGFAPRNPSRLGPGRNCALPRGTVSLPTSPLLGSTRQVEQIWLDPPQSAQAFFNLPDPDRSFEAVPWYSDTYPSSSETIPLSLDDTFAPLPVPESSFNGAPAQMAASSGPMGGVAGTRKKRAQVRIACTHCQKACKKCSNTRPCDRCVKYGLKDCIDSTRKPRKTGVKRGPYKRRSSGKFTNGYYPSASPPLSQESPSWHASSDQGYTQYFHVHTPENTMISPSINSGGYISPPHSQSHFDVHSHAQSNVHLSHLHQQYPAQSMLRNVPPPPRQATFQDGTGIPPGPRTAALHGAFAQALSGPRWVHGQRTGPGTTGEVLYPPTPVVPFPISLNHRDDPFSRAVSPIHGDLGTALQGLKPNSNSCAYRLDVPSQITSQGYYGYAGQNQLQDLPNNPYENTSQNPPIEFTNPFETLPAAASQSHNTQEAQAASAPASPRMTEDWSSLRNGRSSSAEPPQISHPTLTHPLSHAPTFQSSQSPGLVALTKIRKPSLRTLMSHGGSLAPSRQVSPVPEESQSPTLFDQPMELDEVDGMAMDIDLGVWAGVKREGGEMGRAVTLAGPFGNAFRA